MPANLENSAVATGLEKVSFHPNAKKRQTVSFQMFKLVLEKAVKPEIKLPTSDGSPKKQESSRKTFTSPMHESAK